MNEKILRYLESIPGFVVDLRIYIGKERVKAKPTQPLTDLNRWKKDYLENMRPKLVCENVLNRLIKNKLVKTTIWS